MFEVDLHIHSNKSDGIYSREEIINFAIKNNVKVIAITDHDNIDVDSKFKNDHGLIEVPGIEITTNFLKGVHILGYFNLKDVQYVYNELSLINTKHGMWILRFLKKFSKEVFPIKPNDVIDKYGKLSIKNIAQYIEYKGICNNTDEVYSKYIDNIEFTKTSWSFFSPYEAIKVIEKCNGISFLAHPYIISEEDEVVYKIILEFKKYGLKGVECYHPSCNNENRKNDMINFVKSNNLLISGGSDFHGKDSKNTPIGSSGVSMDDWSKISKMIEV